MNESLLQMISLKFLWLGLNLAEFYDRQGGMGTHPSHAVFLVLSLDIQEAFITETSGNTMASILKVRICSQSKHWLTGLLQPGPQGPWGEITSYSLGTIFLFRTKSIVLSLLSFVLTLVHCGLQGRASWPAVQIPSWKYQGFSLSHRLVPDCSQEWPSLGPGPLAAGAVLLSGWKEAPSTLRGWTSLLLFLRGPDFLPTSTSEKPRKNLESSHHSGAWLRYLNSVPVRWERLLLFWKIGRLLKI